MTNQVVFSPQAPEPAGAYSQAIRQGALLFTSGQVGVDPRTQIVAADLRDEIRQALSNLKTVLEAGGSGVASVVRTLCFLTETTHFDIFNEEYSRFFTAPLPARSTVIVRIAGGYRFEIEAIAVPGDSRG